MRHKIFSLLLLISFCQSSMALTDLQEQAKNIVNEYYIRLQEYANNPQISQQNKVLELFDPDGNIVNNDLNGIMDVIRYRDSEDEIKNYLSTIRGLWNNEVSVTIKGNIDETTFVEQEDVELKEKDTDRKLIWVTVNKTIFVKGHVNTNTRETFKIKKGYIQTISTPERATSLINTLRYYNTGDDENAYYSLIKEIESGNANEDTYYYLGLMFRKGDKICKRFFPSKEVRDKLCTFYWMKCERGRRALYYFGVHKYYISDNGDRTDPFPCGLMLAYKGNGEKYGYINKEGNTVIPYKFKKASNFIPESNRAIVVDWNGLVGVIDTKGNYVIQPKYQSILPSNENLWPYQERFRWGFLDDNGNIVIPAQYNNVSKFSLGLAPFSKDKKSGYIDRHNNVVIPAIFDFNGAWPFLQKMQVAVVKIEGKFGAIDKNGKIVVPTEYDEIQVKEDTNSIIVKKGKEQKVIKYSPATVGKSTSEEKNNFSNFTH